MFHIDQLDNPYFPIGLVKTESGFIARSVETDLEIWMLMVTVISVHDYPFFVFPRSDQSPWGYRNRCFLGVLCHRIVRRPNLGSSNQEASPSAGENTGVVLVPCSRMKVRSYSYCWWCGCFWGPWMSLLQHMSSQWWFRKLSQGLTSRDFTTYLSIFNQFKLKDYPYTTPLKLSFPLELD